MRIILAAAATLAALAVLPAAEPARPLAPTAASWGKREKFLGAVPLEFPKQAGVELSVAAGLQKTKFNTALEGEPFWTALQKVADGAQPPARISLASGGRKAELVPRGDSRESAATSGAFRVVTQQVVGRALLAEGVVTHEVQLLVHWEPRLRVYRIDTTPAVSKVTDVPGSKVAAAAGGGQVLPTDATSEMRVRLTGLTRDSDTIKSLAGTFTVTAADRLLAFAFDPAAKLPAPGALPNGEKSPVSAALKRVQKKDDTWEIAVEVTYPEGQPVFQSFEGEWWLRDNRLTVRSPQGKAFVIDDYEIPSPDPRPLVVIYRFKEDRAKGLSDPTQKDWKIVYETPSPLAEVKVPFELKDIPLP